MGSMSRPDELGIPVLKLLAEQWMVATLRGLAEGALRPAELERSLGDGGHATVMRRLRHLLDRGLVGYEHRPGLPPRGPRAAVPRRAYYSLTEGGRMLLEVPAAGADWSDAGCARPPQGAPAAASDGATTAPSRSRSWPTITARDRAPAGRRFAARAGPGRASGRLGRWRCGAVCATSASRGCSSAANGEGDPATS